MDRRRLHDLIILIVFVGLIAMAAFLITYGVLSRIPPETVYEDED